MIESLYHIPYEKQQILSNHFGKTWIMGTLING